VLSGDYTPNCAYQRNTHQGGKNEEFSTMQHDNGNVNIWKGLVAGLAGGLVASWTMNQFQAAWTRVEAGFDKPHGAQSMQPSDGPNPNEQPANGTLGQEQKEQQDDATVETAKVISKKLFGHELTESEKKPAGAAVHYAFGAATGGLYGAMAEVAPQVTAGAGIPFGAVFWAVADETAVPLLGLAKGPTEYPISTHVYALASHLVYGVTAELGRRAVRHVL
jgi:putative membrane protein